MYFIAIMIYYIVSIKGGALWRASFYFRVRVEVMKIWSNSPKHFPNIRQAKRNRLEQDDYSDILPVWGRALTTKRQGKGYLYYPAVSESDCQLAESRSFLSRVYDGSLSKMVMGFVKSGNLSSEELNELKSLIDQQEKTDADTR